MDCFHRNSLWVPVQHTLLLFLFHLCLLRNSKVLFARAQRREVCDPLIYCVWHVNFGWLWTNNPTWLQGVSSIFAIFLTSSHYWFHVFDVQLWFVGAQVSHWLCGKILTCSWYVACGGVVRPALVIFPKFLIHPLVLQLCECPFETITLPILFYQFTMLRFSVFILHLLGFYSLILNWIMLLLLHNEIV